MKMPRPVWYVLVALALLTPLGLRVLTWPTPQPHVEEPTMVEAGKVLFTHEFTPNDPLCPNGDGLGPVYNAASCVACHFQNGVGGSGGLENNVTMFVVREGNGPARQGVVHAHAVNFQETLRDVHTVFPPISQPRLESLLPPGATPRRPPRAQASLVVCLPPGVQLSQRNTPALFGAKWIDEISDHDIIANERNQRLRWAGAPPDAQAFPVGRAFRLPDGRVGRFGWKAQSGSLSSFVQAACANELGLGNPSQPQPRPLCKPDYQPVGLDLTTQQCDQITAFVAALARPMEREPADPALRPHAAAGKAVFMRIGCADCHTPRIGSVEGLYSDLLLHRMGQELEGNGSYNPPPSAPESPGDSPLPDEWRTPPLWGVADSGPYLHDGRAATLEEAIELHAGQAARAAQNFGRLNPEERGQLVAFLKSLRAP
jgi:CxxC motif-containing protein (DUF1111 family)